MTAKHPKSANEFVPKTRSLNVLREAAARCEGCDLYRHATQVVFGQGPGAGIMFIGKQPGDQEGLAGSPLVGAAGKVLDRALQNSSINRGEVYVTNAVKPFKFVERGKRRIHEKPSSAEIGACRPWLEAEVRIVKPQILVCVGATAGQAVFARGCEGNVGARHADSTSLGKIRPSNHSSFVPSPHCRT
jgi:uracil-DNA glycosylase